MYIGIVENNLEYAVNDTLSVMRFVTTAADALYLGMVLESLLVIDEQVHGRNISTFGHTDIFDGLTIDFS